MLLFKRELKRNFKALVIWTLSMGLLMVLMLSLYPQFASNQESLKEMMNAFPEGMMKAFNMDKLGFDTVLGYYAVECYLMMTLFGSIYAALLASSILSKEENEKTAEFLLSKPITRIEVVSQKLLAVVVNLILFNVGVAVFNLIGFSLTKSNGLDVKTFILITAAPFLLHLTFSAVGVALSSAIRKSRNILSISLGLVFVTYFFNIVAGISEKYDWLKYFSPYKYVDSADIMLDKTIKPVYLLIMLGIIVISIGTSYVIYNKKDIAV